MSFLLLLYKANKGTVRKLETAFPPSGLYTGQKPKHKTQPVPRTRVQPFCLLSNMQLNSNSIRQAPNITQQIRSGQMHD